MTEISVTDRIILNALEEDAGQGDITAMAVIPEHHTSRARLVAKEGFVLAGIGYAERVFQLVDTTIKFRTLKKEGKPVRKGDIIATVSGNTRALLKAERTALNLLQRLSGIATLTDKFVTAVKGCPAKITDTRKTTPGFRIFEKYAVKAGGGTNHRFGLFDGVLIKDNHIEAVGSIGKAVKLARQNAHHLMKIEVEAGTLKQVKDALNAGADVIMLDNMSPDNMKKAVKTIRNSNNAVIIEASGNMTLDNIRKTAETGVDLISIGALTHSAPSADISMQFN
jgi:nicotinate-nucleotide pyrophosphorylase (carboxylating)